VGYRFPVPQAVPLLRKQLIAVVDPATTMICLDCAGQVRDLRDEFHTLVGDFQQPPFHRWCRSVVVPYLPGGVDEQRAEANAEILRRPLAERRKGPGGVGARMVPPPHQATLDRRPTGGSTDGYLELFDRILDGPDRVEAEALNRYLQDDVLDWQLRQGRPDGEHLDLVAGLDAAIRARRLREQVTVFTAVDPRISRGFHVSDVVSDDSYLQVSLDPAVAARYGHPVALTLPVGLPAARLDRDSQRLLLARRHSWLLLALGVILVAVLL
jgi:hypothetical protein